MLGTQHQALPCAPLGKPLSSALQFVVYSFKSRIRFPFFFFLVLLYSSELTVTPWAQGSLVSAICVAGTTFLPTISSQLLFVSFLALKFYSNCILNWLLFIGYAIIGGSLRVRTVCLFGSWLNCLWTNTSWMCWWVVELIHKTSSFFGVVKDVLHRWAQRSHRLWQGWGVPIVGTPDRRRGTRQGADVLNNACLVFNVWWWCYTLGRLSQVSWIFNWLFQEDKSSPVDDWKWPSTHLTDEESALKWEPSWKLGTV